MPAFYRVVARPGGEQDDANDAWPRATGRQGTLRRHSAADAAAARSRRLVLTIGERHSMVAAGRTADAVCDVAPMSSTGRAGRQRMPGKWACSDLLYCWSMDKRVAKRHKRQVARAKLHSKKSEPDVRTHEQIEAAREASRPDVGRGRLAKFARAVRSKITGSKDKAEEEK